MRYVVWGALLLVSCGSRPETRRPDSAIIVDLQITDSTSVDAASADLSEDAPASDVTSDLPGADTSVADATVVVDTMTAADTAAPDTQAPDTMVNVDGSVVATPCATDRGQVEQLTAKMVICEGAQGFNQCGAKATCNSAGGWALCTATQYKDNGGATTKPFGAGFTGIAATQEAWMASCVRKNSNIIKPSDSACRTTCGIAPALHPGQEVMWSCQSGVATSTFTATQIGVVAHGACSRLGKNEAANEAYWRARADTLKRNYSLCCKP